MACASNEPSWEKRLEAGIGITSVLGSGSPQADSEMSVCLCARVSVRKCSQDKPVREEAGRGGERDG